MSGTHRTAEEEYSLLMNSMNVSVSKHLLDEHFSVVWANDRYYDMFGYTKAEYEEKFQNRCDVYYERYPEYWKELVDYVSGALMRGDKRYEYVCRMPHRSGKLLWIKLIGNFTGEVVSGYGIAYSVMMDITEQMQLQQEQTVTYNNIPALIAKYRVEKDRFTLLAANQKFYEVFFEHDHSGEYPNEAERVSLAGTHAAMLAGAPVCFRFSPVGRSGKVLHMRVTGTCVDWENESPVYLLIYDDLTQLTEQQKLLERQNAELEELAFGDPVTGGMNRTRFDLVARDAVRRAAPGTYALVLLNVEKFKLINDLAGNAEGNRALKYIHDTLKDCLGEGECLSRVEADNYALLIKDEPDEALQRRLDEMTRRINRFNKGAEHSYILSFTAGVCRIEDAELDMTQIRDRAAAARKGIGKAKSADLCACRFYSGRDREKLMAEKNVENKMRAALEEGQFEVYLQPKLSLESDRVSGAEALVRWNDPERGLVPPGEFIPVFEKNGFIVHLDRYVFERVCSLIRSWLDRGLEPVPVSVNVSRAHFSAPDFVDSYAEICRKLAVPEKYLEIEVTETVAFEDPEAFSEIVRRIHEKGFSCSMDDFGSGYSSLNVLKDIDVDTLKLDRAFFASPGMDNPKERNVVETVIDLAKKLRMTSLAEGVETEDQQLFLKKTGCDLIQGFVFSRPLPVARFEELVFKRS